MNESDLASATFMRQVMRRAKAAAGPAAPLPYQAEPQEYSWRNIFT